MTGVTTKNTYQPLGAAKELFKRKDAEIVVSGPAGTGKSLACLTKLHAVACKYAGCRLLIVRKARASLTQTGLVTFETKVLPQGSTLAQGIQRRNRQSYRYSNGSEIVVGGMDDAAKIMSSEYDVVFVQEATELTEADWEDLTTRLRNGRLPYQQMIADCNPASNTHWLKRRIDQGRVAELISRHEDNPALWDAKAKDWTEQGRSYISKLDALTGVRRLRLRYGLWAATEGGVYEDVWQPAIHIVDRFEIPAEWPRYWSVDFGFTNPFVFQAWCQDPDGRLYRYKEIYKTGVLVEDHARNILKITEGEPRPAAVVCDHDAEGRATLEKYLGLKTTPAFKSVQAGIQAVAARLRVAEDSKPRLFFMRDSLVERDASLDESKKPASTEEEVESYVWNTSAGQRKGEEPVKQDDHGLDACRYIVAHLDLNQKRSIRFY